MTDIHPVRNAVIYAAPAVLTFTAIPRGEVITVNDAEAADAALNDPGNTQHCPLCNQFYGTVAFAAHAPSCITTNAPRWERERDEEPPYANIKRFGKRLIVPVSAVIQASSASADADGKEPS